ncbi:MAG: hypothetical protein AAGA61_08890 [Pseudomonadota bacterium]
MEREIVITDRDVPANVLEAIAEGRKIVAIKLLREATGSGLANAKVIVDRLALEHQRKNPGNTAISEGSNAGRVLALMALVIAGILGWQFFL